jgi:hypothetical protein
MMEAILVAVVLHMPPETPGQDVLGLKEYASFDKCVADAKIANDNTPEQYHRTFYCEKIVK